MEADGKREHWRGLIEQQRTSGQSIVAWCTANGLKEWQYYAWKARLKKDDTPGGETSAGFIPLELPTCAALVIRFGDDIHVEVGAGCALGLLRSTLEVLRGRTRCWR